jgi:hypothetical protein
MLIGYHRVERASAASVDRFLGEQYLVHGQVEGGGDLTDGRNAAECGGQSIDDCPLGDCVLVRATWHPHEPAMISVVTTQSAEDRRGRKGGEGQPSVGVEAPERNDERLERDLVEVLVRFVVSMHAGSQRTCVAVVLVDETSKGSGIVPARHTDVIEPHRRLDGRVTRCAAVGVTLFRDVKKLQSLDLPSKRRD